MPLPRFAIPLLLAVFSVPLAGSPPAPTVWQLTHLQELGGKPLTVLGTPRVVTEAGQTGIVFNGRTDGIFVAANPIAGAAVFTIEVLFKPEEGGLEAQRFFHLEDQQAWRVMIETRLDGQGHWWLDTFLGKPGINQPLIDAQRVHPTNQWYWVALRFDGKHMTHFINGQQELERDATFEPMTEAQLSLGVRQNKVYWFKGGIREIRWHREAIAPEQLQR